MNPQLHTPAALPRSLAVATPLDELAVADLKNAGYRVYHGNGAEAVPAGVALPPRCCSDDYDPDLDGYWWTDASCAVGPTVATEEEAWRDAALRESAEVFHG